MEKGDKVMVYQDPLTREKEEGEATLYKRQPEDSYLKSLRTEHGVEAWYVEFAEEPGNYYQRLVGPVGEVA